MRVRESRPRQVELLEESPGYRDVQPAEVGSERLCGLRWRAALHHLRRFLRRSGQRHGLRFIRMNQILARRSCRHDRLDQRQLSRPRDQRHHLPPRDRLDRIQLSRDFPRLPLGAVEEARHDLGAVLRRDDLRELDEAGDTQLRSRSARRDEKACALVMAQASHAFRGPRGTHGFARWRTIGGRGFCLHPDVSRATLGLQGALGRTVPHASWSARSVGLNTRQAISAGAPRGAGDSAFSACWPGRLRKVDG